MRPQFRAVLTAGALVAGLVTTSAASTPALPAAGAQRTAAQRSAPQRSAAGAQHAAAGAVLAAAGSGPVLAAVGSGPALAGVPAAAALPASPCALAGTVRTCELWAKAGTLALPAGSSPASVPVWGYASSADGPAQVPGPLLLATVGETVRIVVHNALAEQTSLALPAQPLAPDQTGAAPGGERGYEFAATSPGTFSYEAGATPGGPKQVAMGLAGALVVLPATAGTAYGTEQTGYDDEALVVLQAVDPAFAGAPAAYEMSTYRPRFWLINGRSYPETEPISTGAGRRLLLRVVNAGLQDHALTLLGGYQNVVAGDGEPLTHPHMVLSETVAAGGTIDAIVTIPPGTPAGTSLALYEAGRHIDNAGRTTGDQVDFGGMITFVTVAA